MGRDGFQGLKVWQKSKDLAVQIYKITEQGMFGKDYGLRDQVRRSSVSIPSNIAEGDERDTDKEAVRHLYIAKGSAAELLTQLIIAHEVNYIDETTFKELEEKCLEISGMLSRLIAARSKTFNH
jgi:four helix bundle protein